MGAVILIPASEIKPDGGRGWMVTLVAIILWIDANAVLYWWGDDSRSEQGRPEPDAEVLAAYQEYTLNVGEVQLGFRLLRPAELIEGRRYPLVVYLHGAGEVGSDNRQQLNDLPRLMIRQDYRNRFDCLLLAPQCPEGANWATPIVALLEGATSATVTAAMPAIDAVMVEHPIDPQRVYLTGFSMGGFGTWSLAAQRPEMFAAIVPVCGCGDTANAPKLVGLPVWAVHGGLDALVPAEQSQRMVDALIDAGGEPKLNILPDAGHQSKWAYALDSGVLDWMFQKGRSD